MSLDNISEPDPDNTCQGKMLAEYPLVFGFFYFKKGFSSARRQASFKMLE